MTKNAFLWLWCPEKCPEISNLFCPENKNFVCLGLVEVDEWRLTQSRVNVVRRLRSEILLFLRPLQHEFASGYWFVKNDGTVSEFVQPGCLIFVLVFRISRPWTWKKTMLWVVDKLLIYYCSSYVPLHVTECLGYNCITKHACTKGHSLFIKLSGLVMQRYCFFGIRYDIDTILPKYLDIDTISIFCK